MLNVAVPLYALAQYLQLNALCKDIASRMCGLPHQRAVQCSKLGGQGSISKVPPPAQCIQQPITLFVRCMELCPLRASLKSPPLPRAALRPPNSATKTAQATSCLLLMAEL